MKRFALVVGLALLNAFPAIASDAGRSADVIATILSYQTAIDPYFRGIPDPKERQRIADVFSRRMRGSNAEHAGMRFGRSALPRDALLEAARKKIILFGDWHNGENAVQKRVILELIDALGASAREKVFTAEFVAPEHQAALDAFILEGRMTVEELRERIRFDDDDFGAFGWPYFRDILLALRKHRIKSLALMKPSPDLHWGDLDKRDDFVVRELGRYLAAHPNAQALVFFGHLHLVGKTHLGERLARAYRGETVRLLSDVSELFPAAALRNFRRFYRVESSTGIPTWYYYSIPFDSAAHLYGLEVVVNAVAASAAKERAEILVAEFRKLDPRLKALTRANLDRDEAAIRETLAAAEESLCRLNTAGFEEIRARPTKNAYDRKVLALFRDGRWHCAEAAPAVR